jgi:hypothetical protein
MNFVLNRGLANNDKAPSDASKLREKNRKLKKQLETQVELNAKKQTELEK